MNLPPELQQWLNRAQVDLDRQDSLDETIRYRFPIYAFFSRLPGLQGRIARTYLGLKATQRALPMWGSERDANEAGYETMPTLMLYAAQHLLTAMMAGATATEIDVLAQQATVEINSGTVARPSEISIGSFHDLSDLACEMDSITGESQSSRYWLDWCVFLAALNTLVEALRSAAPMDALTGEVDKWGGDSAKWAATAYGGGRWTAFEPPSFIDFSPQGTWDFSASMVSARRRESWKWWFLDVVPEAYKSLLK